MSDPQNLQAVLQLYNRFGPQGRTEQSILEQRLAQMQQQSAFDERTQDSRAALLLLLVAAPMKVPLPQSASPPPLAIKNEDINGMLLSSKLLLTLRLL